MHVERNPPQTPHRIRFRRKLAAARLELAPVRGRRPPPDDGYSLRMPGEEYDLPVEGFQVSRIDVGFPLHLMAAADRGRRCRGGLNSRFWYRDADGTEHVLDAERDSWEKWTPMFALREDTIKRAHVSEINTLSIEFRSDRSILVKATGDGYEAWEVTITDWGVAVG